MSGWEELGPPKTEEEEEDSQLSSAMLGVFGQIKITESF